MERLEAQERLVDRKKPPTGRPTITQYQWHASNSARSIATIFIIRPFALVLALPPRRRVHHLSKINCNLRTT